MKSKALFFGAAFLPILFLYGGDADILGNWIARLPEDHETHLSYYQDGTSPARLAFHRIPETVFSFKADGKKLTGTVSGPDGKIAISEGEINGDEISFIVAGGAADHGMTMEYRGKVGLNEIRFTRKPRDRAGESEKFVATREFLRHNDYIPRQLTVPLRTPPSR